MHRHGRPATGKLGVPDLPGLALRQRPQVGNRSHDRDTHLHVRSLRSELVVAPVGRSARRPSEIGNPVREEIARLGEESEEVLLVSLADNLLMVGIHKRHAECRLIPITLQ